MRRPRLGDAVDYRGHTWTVIRGHRIPRDHVAIAADDYRTAVVTIAAWHAMGSPDV